MRKVAVALGSNLGDRVSNLLAAIKALSEVSIKVTQLSRLYESAPAYVTDQPTFLNAAAIVETNLGPLQLLSTLKNIEKDLGRNFQGQRWGPRPIDLDIIFYEDEHVHDDDKLIVPHPRWQERNFVKAPLADLYYVGDSSKAQSPNTNTHLCGGGLASCLAIANQLWRAEGGEALLGMPDLRCVLPMGRLGLWSWQDRPKVMGILNVTPDSFSDGGSYSDVHEAVAGGRLLASQGADIIDVGGQSTRPGAQALSPEEEMRRVIPVIKSLSEDPATANVPISIDTFFGDVAEAAVAAGATMINDVSGGLLDPKMFQTVARLGNIPYVLMHMRGTPQTMQSSVNTAYQDVVTEVARELQDRVDHAVQAGIESWRIVLDPGIGFAKTEAANMQLIAQMGRLRMALNPPLRGAPFLAGPSRKRFLGALTGRKEAKDRDWGTVAAAALCVFEGGNIIRAHNVGAVKDAVLVAGAAKRAREASTPF